MDVLQILHEAVEGRFPRADGAVEVLDLPGKAAGVLAFSAHFYVCAPVDPSWVAARLPLGDYLAPLSPGFLLALAERIGADVGSSDAVLAAKAHGGAAPVDLEPIADSDHARVRRARRYRDDVRVWRTRERDGHVVIGRGFAGRTELAFEVDISAQGRGLGRALAASALALVPAGTPVFAQVAPGHTASMRATLAAGYRPIGGEVLLPPHSPAGPA